MKPIRLNTLYIDTINLFDKGKYKNTNFTLDNWNDWMGYTEVYRSNYSEYVVKSIKIKSEKYLEMIILDPITLNIYKMYGTDNFIKSNGVFQSNRLNLGQNVYKVHDAAHAYMYIKNNKISNMTSKYFDDENSLKGTYGQDTKFTIIFVNKNIPDYIIYSRGFNNIQYPDDLIHYQL